METMQSPSIITGLFELPFLLMCIYFAFQTANALKGGIFGRGMTLLAWGFLVMAIGHAHMQLEHFLGFNLINMIFGRTVGQVVWISSLVVTWGLSGVGFYKIYSASRSTVGA